MNELKYIIPQLLAGVEAQHDALEALEELEKEIKDNLDQYYPDHDEKKKKKHIIESILDIIEDYKEVLEKKKEVIDKYNKYEEWPYLSYSWA